MKLHQIFEKVAYENPDTVAAKFQGYQLTYRELNEAANQLANHLRNKLPKDFNLAEKQPVIGVHLKPSENPLIAMLAISKLGGIYVPLDTAKDKKIQDTYLTSVCQDSQVNLIISEGDLNLSYDCTKIYLDKEEKAIIACDKDYVFSTCAISPSEQNAYYCYSSGTTGAPKGIPIRHSGLEEWFKELETLRSANNPNRVVLSHIAIGFDAHIWEYLMAWALRGSVCIAKQESTTEELAQLMQAEEVTDATLVPAILDPIASLPNPPRKNNINVYSTGSALTKELTEKCLNQGYEVYNCYGPTEATFGLTWYRIQYKVENGKKIATEFETLADETEKTSEHAPMGRARFKDVEIFVLDENNNVITEEGRPGRLAYLSPYMTKGYIGRPDETDKNFIKIQKPDGTMVKVHRTDDICELKNNNLYFIKRIGNNLKIDSAFSNGDKVKKSLRENGEFKDKISYAEVVSLDGPPPYSVAFYQVRSDITNPPTLNDIYLSLRNEFGNQESMPYLQQISNLPLNNKKEPDIAQLKLLAKKINRDDSRPCVPPTTSLQKELVELWAQALAGHRIEKDDIGIADDFGIFGTSMDRKVLREAINSKYKINIKYETIWEDSFTIERLEQLVLNEISIKFEINVLKSASDNGKESPPFFLLPSITGNGPDDYVIVKSHLKKANVEQTVYAFKAPGLIDTSYSNLTIQELINHYYDLLIKTQPKGPYYLGGWSSGALMAYGIAQKLKETGNEVSYLALIDEAAPPKSAKDYNQTTFAKDLLELVKHLPASTTSEITLTNLSNKSCEEQVNFVFNNLTPKQNTESKAEDTLAVVKQFLLGTLKHDFKKINDTEIHVFYTDKTLQNNANKESLNWDQYGNVTKTTRVGEDHFSPVKQPQYLVKEIAAQIKLHEHSDGDEKLHATERRGSGSDASTTSSNDQSNSPTLPQNNLPNKTLPVTLAEVNSTIQNAIYTSLKTPCNVLTILQLLQKLYEWYILALVKLSSHNKLARQDYEANELIFNKAVLAIISELKTKAVGQNNLPSWLNAWLAEVEKFANTKVTTMEDEALQDHCLALKRFSKGENSDILKKLSNQDNNFSTILSKAEDAINELDDGPTGNLSPLLPKADPTKPLYNALVNHADSFAEKIKKKKNVDFHYKSEDFIPKVTM